MRIIGYGIDLVEVDRVARMLRDHPERFVERCFTPGERTYAEAGGARAVRAERYAARFACKEAVLKAIGTGWSRGIAWTEIDVRATAAGRPVLSLSGRCAAVAAETGIQTWQISISHTAGLAMASAIACGEA